MCGLEIFDGTHLCPDCAKTVTKNNKISCPVCGRRVTSRGICEECKYRMPVFEKCVSALVYADGAMALVYKFKTDGAYLKDWFAELLQTKLKELPKPDALIPVPASKKSARRRGYDQTRLLAESLSRLTGIEVLTAVKKTTDTPAQKNLKYSERVKNLAGTFEVTDKNAIRGKSVLIVDDVMTTGATLNEVARVLKKCGAAHVYAAVVASVEYGVKTNPLLSDRL